MLLSDHYIHFRHLILHDRSLHNETYDYFCIAQTRHNVCVPDNIHTLVAVPSIVCIAILWLEFSVSLTYWGRVSKLNIIRSDNGLSPGRCQAIIWTSAGKLSLWPLGTNFSEMLIKIYTFSFKKMFCENAVSEITVILSLPLCVKPTNSTPGSVNLEASSITWVSLPLQTLLHSLGIQSEHHANVVAVNQ